MGALTVDQNQGLVRRQAAQGDRADAVGAVGDGRAREIDGRRQLRQALGQFRGRLGSQTVELDDIDGGEGIKA